MMGVNTKFMIWGRSVTRHKKMGVVIIDDIRVTSRPRCGVVDSDATTTPLGVVGTSTLQPCPCDHLVDVPTTARHDGGGCGGDMPTTSWHEGGRADRTEQHGRKTLPRCR